MFALFVRLAKATEVRLAAACDKLLGNPKLLAEVEAHVLQVAGPNPSAEAIATAIFAELPKVEPMLKAVEAAAAASNAAKVAAAAAPPAAAAAAAAPK